MALLRRRSGLSLAVGMNSERGASALETAILLPLLILAVLAGFELWKLAVLKRALELYEFDTVLLPVNPAEPHHQSFLPLAQEALDRGLGVIGMKVLCRGKLPRMAEDPEALVWELVNYAWSQAVSLVVVGADGARPAPT